MKANYLTLVKESLPLKAATSLTLFRIVISPIFLMFYLYYEKFGIDLTVLPYLLMIILGVVELSDFFDGYLARKWDQVTDLGKVLDPMADSIARLSVLLTFTQGIIQVPLLLVFIFLYRDAVISTLRTLCALRGVTLSARMSGKVKAVIQAIASFIILLLMIPYSLNKISLDSLRSVSFYVVLIAAIYTLGSGIEYIYANRFYIKKAWTKD